jgi:serine/threonine-protein kinase
MGYVELVFRREQRFERLYARKRLHPQFRADPAFRAMFMDEARLAGLVRHPNVVAVQDLGEDEEGPFLIMDYVEGLPVARLIARATERGESVPAQVAVRIAVGAALGLHAAHEAVGPDGAPLGLVHRDVSPQNILVGFDGVVRVTDFGIAKAMGNAMHTTTGVLKGNVGYLSPEQLRFETPDRRADLFSLGVVLYELLAGRRLYAAAAGDGPRRILNEAPPDIGEVRSDLPPALCELLIELLSKDRALRPPTALEVARRLEAVLAALVEEEGPSELDEHLAARFGDERAAQRARVDEARRALDRPAVDPARSRTWPRRAWLATAAAVLLVGGVGMWWARSAPSGGAAGPGDLSVWAGGWHSCAVDRGRLFCWGKNTQGQLGNGNTTDAVAPVRVSPLPAEPIGVALGSFHTCACTATGQALCWGRAREGQLGAPRSEPALVPAVVPGVDDCVQVVAGSNHACALGRDGRVTCWGQSDKGQAGVEQDVRPPGAVAGLPAVDRIAAAWEFTCAVAAADGRVWCWGTNEGGQLGEGRVGGHRGVPAAVEGLREVAEISVGRNTACARTRGGRVSCWGQRGDPKAGARIETSTTPVAVPALERAVQIAVSASHACAVRLDGHLACFGSDHFGQLGLGTRGLYHETPVSPVGLEGVLSVATGEVHTCARHARGVSCWGGNFTGQLGDGTTELREHPVSVIGLAR